MEIMYGLVGVALGIVLASVYLRSRKRGGPEDADQRERELKAVLDEVRELRTDIDILKVNPTIGDAVKATIDFARDQPDFEPSAYNVATRPGKLPSSAYNVAVKPGPITGRDPRT